MLYPNSAPHAGFGSDQTCTGWHAGDATFLADQESSLQIASPEVHLVTIHIPVALNVAVGISRAHDLVGDGEVVGHESETIGFDDTLERIGCGSWRGE